MNLERELRDALLPLAGDPVADAARVLAALPPLPGPGKPGAPPIAWWLLAAGIVVGALLGAFVGRATAPAKEAEKLETPDKPKDDKPQPAPPTMLSSDMMMLTAFDDLAVDEPGQGFQNLRAGVWELWFGSSIVTRGGQAGFLIRGDLRGRIDRNTQVRVAANEFALTTGRIWIDTGVRQNRINIDAEIAALVVDTGEVMVERTAEGVLATAIAGDISVKQKAGEVVRLLPGNAVWIGTERGFEPPKKVPFLAAATSWMTEMITLETDDTQLRQRIKDMVAAYEAGTFRELAEREIRKLGSRCSPLLIYGALQRLPNDAAYAQKAATLAVQLAEFRNVQYVFQLLECDSGELRRLAAEGIERITGIASGKDAEFWTSAPAIEREPVVATWKNQVFK
jgi:hypothetical protein